MIDASVLLSVYNGDAYLEQALESVLSQQQEHLEFIFVNDGSTDGTARILSDIAARDPRVRVLTHTSRQGLTRSLNEGLAVCTGRYIIRMDADDISLPGRIAAQLAYMDTHQEVGVCGTFAAYIDELENVLGKKILPTRPEEIKKKMLFNNMCVHSSLCIRKRVLDELGGYNEVFDKSQDYELLLRIGQHYDIANIPKILIHWRVHKDSISWMSKGQERDAIRARWIAIRKYRYPKLRGIFHILMRTVWYVVPLSIKKRRYVS